MVKEKFQIYDVMITGNYICESKIESVHFYSCPQTEGNRYSPGRRKLLIPPKQRFPQQKGGRIMELKKLPKLNL